MKRKLTALLLVLCMVFALAACGTSAGGNSDAVYTIGICQIQQHEALDAATLGFQDAIIDALGEDAVVFDVQNASGDSNTCAVICNNFVSNGYDLILANATPSLQAAHAATNEIPILGTSITDYATALEIEDWTGTVGGNISGTSDLAPLDEQAAMIKELFPEAENVGILYCSSEANSVYQANVITGHLEALGFTVTTFTFSDSNDIATVTAAACDASDVIFIPTDNTAASYTETINNVAIVAGVPIVAGEGGICSGCGVATLSIDYYDLGYATGEMAVEILVNGAEISTMPIAFSPAPTKMYNTAICETLDIEVPDDYAPLDQ